MANFKSQFSQHVLTTTLENIEKYAVKVYTVEIFKEVKEEIVTERVEKGEKVTVKLTKYGSSSSRIKVVHDTSKTMFNCSCRSFESRGIPCSHIFVVMKEEQIDDIPSGLIMSRWTKNAKGAISSSDSPEGMDFDWMDLARFGAYCGAFNRFCRGVSNKKNLYNEIMDDIWKLIDKYEKLVEPVGTQSSSIKHHVDPNLIKTKGAPKKTKFGMKRSNHCSNYGSTRHNVRTCPRHCS